MEFEAPRQWSRLEIFMYASNKNGRSRFSYGTYESDIHDPHLNEYSTDSNGRPYFPGSNGPFFKTTERGTLVITKQNDEIMQDLLDKQTVCFQPMSYVVGFQAQEPLPPKSIVISPIFSEVKTRLSQGYTAGCEDDTYTFTCPSGQVPNRLDFLYGRWDQTLPCDSTPFSRYPSTINTYVSLPSGITSIKMNNATFDGGLGDPAPGARKQFVAKTTCIAGSAA